MLGKAQIKYIQSLRQKKIRHTEQAYIVEGEKIVGEYIQFNHPLKSIYATRLWIRENEDHIQRKKLHVVEVNEKELKKISTLTTPNKVLAVAEMNSGKKPDLISGFHIALENIQDPGNMGTIIRTADWFGVDSILCSENCVDIYNPKVVQSAMGSLLRVKIYFVSLSEVLNATRLPTYAATLEGKSIVRQELPEDAILLIGNESQGISESILELVKNRVTIPRVGGAESLNASIAAAVLMAYFQMKD